jgi:hypothetical protein
MTLQITVLCQKLNVFFAIQKLPLQTSNSVGNNGVVALPCFGSLIYSLQIGW